MEGGTYLAFHNGFWVVDGRWYVGEGRMVGGRMLEVVGAENWCKENTSSKQIYNHLVADS